MTLSALFVPLMAYVQGLDRQQMPEAQSVHDELQRLIRQARELALSQEIELQHFHDALFPVAAWVDERLALLPQWQQERPWRSFMLQRKLFSTSLAGVQFFQRLEQLGPDEQELREVYVTCMALGFVGRFSQNQNSPEFIALRQDQYRLLRPEQSDQSENEVSRLFPEAYRLVTAGSGRQRRWRPGSRLFWLLAVLLPVLAIVGVAYWFDYLLGEQVSEITRRLP
jgi:type VI secretion system protein ImpK